MRHFDSVRLSKWHQTHVREQGGGLESCPCEAPALPRFPIATTGHLVMARQEPLKTCQLLLSVSMHPCKRAALFWKDKRKERFPRIRHLQVMRSFIFQQYPSEINTVHTTQYRVMTSVSKDTFACFISSSAISIRFFLKATTRLALKPVSSMEKTLSS